MLLTTAATVDNLAEKVDKCPLNWGHYILFVYNWDCKNCLLYRVVGCPLFRGCLSTEVNRRRVRIFRIVWVPAVEGGLLCRFHRSAYRKSVIHVCSGSRTFSWPGRAAAQATGCKPGS